MRRFELDSLRGIAALIVLAYHSLAINILEFAKGSQFQQIESFWGNVLAYTPLRIFWSGGEAVWIFFVLSGFVLSTSAKAPSFRWGAYFPSRLIRLYLPVGFAILLTLFCIRIFPHVITDENKQFLGGAAVSYPFSSVVNDFLVVTGPTNTLGPLWSLRWEILFSLLLPLYLFASTFRKNVWLIVSLFCMVIGFSITNEFLMYMPMFYVGVWLSTFDFHEISLKLNKKVKSNFLQTSLGVICLGFSATLVTSYWIWGNQFRLELPVGISTLAFFAIVKILGIALLLTTILVFTRIQQMFSHRILIFLGTISFSLYLVHWPIVIATAFILGPGWESAAVGFVISLLFSMFFYYAIEAKSHKLSRKISSSIKQLNQRYSGYPL